MKGKSKFGFKEDISDTIKTFFLKFISSSWGKNPKYLGAEITDND